MKITKEQIKQILLEDLNNPNSALLAAIGGLTQKIDRLDVSIDYLAGAVTGQDPASIGYSQRALGRFARSLKPSQSRYSAVDSPGMNEIVDAIVEELNEEHGGEGEMVVNQLSRLTQIVEELVSMVDASDNHEEWVESKITKAHDYLSTVLDYLAGKAKDLSLIHI